MPADPRQLKLEIEHLRNEPWGLAGLLAVLARAEALARNLPFEKTCKDQTWKNLRSSELLEELVVMTTVLADKVPQPTARCLKGP